MAVVRRKIARSSRKTTAKTSRRFAPEDRVEAGSCARGPYIADAPAGTLQELGAC